MKGIFFSKNKLSKYHNEPVYMSFIEEGKAVEYRFDSKGEKNRYIELLLLQQAGKIRSLKRQVSFNIQDSFNDIYDNKLVRSINYTCDFYYYDEDNKRYVAEDFKGAQTDVFKLKWKLVKCKYQDENLEFRLTFDEK